MLELCRIDEGLPEEPEEAKPEPISLLDWCKLALERQGYVPAAHHRLLIAELEAVARGDIKRLMVFMPPGSAKSTYVSQLFPAWLFSQRKYLNIIGASHTSDLAEDFSGKIHDIIRDNHQRLGYELATEARGRWYTTNGGSYLAAGVGGAIPGFRADFAIIDDPIKGRMAADLEADRKKVWDWYLGDLERRLTPGASIILMHTRWHMDDLAGRLLGTEPERWRVLKLPALATEIDDPLGRAIDEPLWADDTYGYGDELIAIRDGLEKAGATREWASQYQQTPRPAEGALFKVGLIEVLDEAPNLRGAIVGRGWDLAATKQIGTRDPDWTVGVKLARMPSGLYVILDVVRFRGNPDDVDAVIRNTASQDGMAVTISIPQDPGQAGKKQVLAFTRLLTGHKVESSPETGDKATRAAPAISQVNGRNFAMVKAPWNAAFRDELAAFPSGTKDDQVDALSRAFSIVGLDAKPLVISDDILAALGQR